VITRSSVAGKYRAMAHISCELIWIESLLLEIGVVYSQSMVMYCDNLATMYIDSNLVFHEKIKHIEVNYHFIQYMVMAKQNVTSLLLKLSYVIFLKSFVSEAFFGYVQQVGHD